jgi:transporter family protein
MAIFLMAVIFFQGNLNKIPQIISNKKAFSFIILSGVAGALSWLFYFLALKFGTVAKVAPIDKFSVVIATVLSILFLGEKISKLNGLGVGLIAIGAIIVALS